MQAKLSSVYRTTATYMQIAFLCRSTFCVIKQNVHVCMKHNVPVPGEMAK